jgi:hypothetical protein
MAAAGRSLTRAADRISGAGTNQGFGVGRKVALGISIRGGDHTAKMVEGGQKEKHVLVNKRLDDGRVGRG